MKKDSPIGFFDSGVGGLSVYSKFKKLLPSENIIYYGDLKNLPYGNKTQSELIFFAKNILDFFEKKAVKAVVIACNTSSALAYEYVKNNYSFKIYPIIQSCANVISSMPISRLGVFATVGTVNSGAYTKEVLKYNPNMSVKEIPCPNWVSIVEGVNEVDSVLDIKTHLDEMMLFNPEKIILGCTHYPYLLDTLTEFAPRELFIDPASVFVEYIKNDLAQNKMLNNSFSEGYSEFYVSANPKQFLKNSKLFCDLEGLPKLV